MYQPYGYMASGAAFVRSVVSTLMRIQSARRPGSLSRRDAAGGNWGQFAAPKLEESAGSGGWRAETPAA